MRVELDAPLFNFRMAGKFVHKLGDSFVSLAWVVELVTLESLHFKCIFCEFLGQTSMTADFRRKVDYCVSLVYEDTGLLVDISQCNFILKPEVLSHCSFHLNVGLCLGVN